jgi:glutamate dehydrogenase (NADP+)
VSGSGNVAQYAVEKIIQMGGKALTLSDSNGMIHDPDGINADKLNYVFELKNFKRGRIREYVEKYPKAKYQDIAPGGDCNPLWDLDADCAFPCATQNEINGKDALNLCKRGVKLVAEGANMPTEPDGVKVFLENKILYGPGKAANAGGVSTSGLEMSQNGMKLSWPREEVDRRLNEIMKAIHHQCRKYGTEANFCNYVKGANIAGFKKVADAMLEQGLV